MASRHLGHHGRKLRTLSSIFTVHEHEFKGKLTGIGPDHRLRHRLMMRSGYLWMKHMVRRYDAMAACGADLTVVNYDSVRRLIVIAFGNCNGSVRIVPYTSELAIRGPCKPDIRAEPDVLRLLASRDMPLIVSVSRHDPRKGVDVLIRALAELKQAGVDYRACLVGGGFLLNTHQRLAKELELGSNVVITGLVDSVRRYLEYADVFVLPSHEEGSGSLSLLEAMQSGLAIVASGVDGIGEDVTHERSAILVPPGDPPALADALGTLLKDATLRRKLGREAVRVFNAQHHPDMLVRCLADLYA